MVNKKILIGIFFLMILLILGNNSVNAASEVKKTYSGNKISELQADLKKAGYDGEYNVNQTGEYKLDWAAKNDVIIDITKHKYTLGDTREFTCYGIETIGYLFGLEDKISLNTKEGWVNGNVEPR